MLFTWPLRQFFSFCLLCAAGVGLCSNKAWAQEERAPIILFYENWQWMDTMTTDKPFLAGVQTGYHGLMVFNTVDLLGKAYLDSIGLDKQNARGNWYRNTTQLYLQKNAIGIHICPRNNEMIALELSNGPFEAFDVVRFSATVLNRPGKKRNWTGYTMGRNRVFLTPHWRSWKGNLFNANSWEFFKSLSDSSISMKRRFPVGKTVTVVREVEFIGPTRYLAFGGTPVYPFTTGGGYLILTEVKIELVDGPSFERLSQLPDPKPETTPFEPNETER